MKFDIRQLTIFVEVARQASFSKAAVVLGVAQASVSERIANLEKAVGVRLLDRLGRKVELTRAGALLLERAGEILALKEQTARELRSLMGVGTGEILVGGSTAPGEYILPKYMGLFAKQYPGVNLRLDIGDSREITEKIALGTLEVGVVGQRFPGENLVNKKVWSDEIVLVVNSEHRWAKRRKPVTGEDLVAENWVVREPGSGTRSAGEKVLKRIVPASKQSRNVAAELGSVTAVKEAVMAGLGIAFVSKVTVSRELKNGSLKLVKIEDPLPMRHFYLVRDKRRVLSPAADAFWKFILEEAKK